MRAGHRPGPHALCPVNPDRAARGERGRGPRAAPRPGTPDSVPGSERDPVRLAALYPPGDTLPPGPRVLSAGARGGRFSRLREPPATVTTPFRPQVQPRHGHRPPKESGLRRGPAGSSTARPTRSTSRGSCRSPARGKALPHGEGDGARTPAAFRRQTPCGPRPLGPGSDQARAPPGTGALLPPV